MAVKRSKSAVASFICALPCALLSIWASIWCLFLARGKADFEDLITLGLYAVWMLPLAIISVIFACFAGELKVRCMWFASIYFFGWLLVYIGVGIRL
jgi:hypothetical protein